MASEDKELSRVMLVRSIQGAWIAITRSTCHFIWKSLLNPIILFDVISSSNVSSKSRGLWLWVVITVDRKSPQTPLNKLRVCVCSCLLCLLFLHKSPIVPQFGCCVYFFASSLICPQLCVHMHNAAGVAAPARLPASSQHWPPAGLYLVVKHLFVIVSTCLQMCVSEK